MVVFKERLAMFMLSRVLETLRDILLIMPLSTQQMQLQSQNEEVKRIKQYQLDFKEYIDKIVIERKFTARFVANSG